MEQITQYDRSPYVKDNNFGKIRTINTEEFDMPRYAVIEYDKSGQVVHEDYSKLNKILYDVISNNVKQLNIVNPVTGQKELTKTVQGNVLTELKLSEKEMEYAIKYLSLNDVLVRGMDSSLDGEFDSYQYTNTYKTVDLPPAFTKEENTELFRKMKLIKEELSVVNDEGKRRQLENKMYEIRDNLIQGNMRLVDYILYRNLPSAVTDTDREDMQQIGYEVLIEFIDKYDVDKGYALSTGLYNYLMYHVWRKYNDTKMIQIPEKLQDRIRYIMKIKDEIESVLGRDASIREIAEKMQYPVNVVEEAIMMNNRQNLENIGDLQSENIIDEQYYYDDFINEEDVNQFITTLSSSLPELMVMDTALKDKIDQVFSTLTKNEVDVLKLRLGFYDGKVYTETEVANILGMTRERVLHYENKAIRKLRQPGRFRENKDFYFEDDMEDRYGNNNYKSR